MASRTNDCHQLVFICVVLCSVWTPILSSAIVFESSPSEIKSGLTGELILRCSLNDTASSGIVGRRDVTQTADNVEEVFSVIISQNGVEVATVSHKHAAHMLTYVTSSASASGNISDTGHGSERGILELTFKYPTAAQSGEFACEINAINEVGHAVLFSQSLEVGISDPTLTDLASYIQKLEAKHEAEMTSTKQRLDQLEKENEALKSRLDEAEHTETGFIECDGKTHTWVTIPDTIDNLHFRAYDVITKFKTPYSEPPVVKVGVTEMDHTSSKNIRYVASIVSVSKDSFTVRCATWSDSFVYRLGVSWISVADRLNVTASTTI